MHMQDYGGPDFASPKQRTWLRDILDPGSSDYARIEHMTNDEAHHIIANHRTTRPALEDRRSLPATPRQRYILSKCGLWRDSMTQGEAFDVIAKLKEDSV